MHVKNTLTEYGLISKLLHWISAILLFIQIPLGFYLVDLDFGPERLTVEDIHVTMGLSIFYLVILRLLYKIFNPTPELEPSVFKGQKFLAKLNHVMLYVTILSITISGILKNKYLQMIRNRYISTLLSLTEEQIADGIIEIKNN